MKEYSAACELSFGSPYWMPEVNALYDIPDRLFAIKDKLERQLSSLSVKFFNLENRIVLFYPITLTWGAQGGQPKGVF